MTNIKKITMPFLTEGQKLDLIGDLKVAIMREPDSVYGYAARIAIAALTAEPFGYTCQTEVDGIKKGKTTRIVSHCTNGDPLPVYLYPPAASAVPNITTLVTRAYNTGYTAGHNDTVESRYIDIHRNDIDSYHSEEVSELIEDAAPSPQEGE